MWKHDLLKSLFAALLLCAALFCSAGTVKLTVIQTTDIHAQTDGRRTPGIARLASVIKAERTAAGGRDHVLLIDCGDLFQGSYQATLDHGGSLVHYLNLLSYDAFIPGNHDFDFGTSELVKHLNGIQAAVLALNLNLKGAPPGRILKWKMFEKNTLKIAVAGMTSPYLFSWLSGIQTAGLELTDYQDALAEIIPEIMEAKPDIVILAMHNGEFMPARLGSSGGKKRMSAGAFLRKYPQIDLVLGGHSHQEGAGKQVASSWYIQAPALSGGAAVAEILYDKKKRRIVSLKSRIAYAADAEPDAETAEMLEPLLEQSRRKGTRRIARMAFPLEPLKKSGAGNRLSRIFGRAMMRETGAEIALHGTLSSYRASPGILYASQVYLLAPYENLLCTLEISPAECRAIIEEQYAEKRSGSFQAVTGVSFKMGKGGKIRGGLFLDGETEEWNDGARPVKLVLSGYTLAGAGGRFPVLKAIGEKKKVDFLSLDVRSALEKYLAAEYPCSQTWKPEEGD